MINKINYIYKCDDNTYWSMSGYIDNFGFIVPIYATRYSYGIRMDGNKEC